MANNVARTLLAVSFPLLFPAPPPPLLSPGINSIFRFPPPPSLAILAFQLHTAEKRAAHREKPRPEQGGQRITEEWLRSLKTRDCLWRFRCICCICQCTIL